MRPWDQVPPYASEIGRVVGVCAAVMAGRHNTETFVSVVTSLHLRGYHYSLGFLLVAFFWPREWGPRFPDCVFDELRASTTLLPPEATTPLTRAELTHRVTLGVGGRKRRPPATDAWMALLDEWLGSPEDDGLAQQCFPPRTRGDMAIRNTRFADFLGLPFDGDTLRLRLSDLSGYDYITALNILIASYLFEPMDWWGFWTDCGAFDGDTTRFRDVTRSGADIVKKVPSRLSADHRVVLYETAGLFGALLPPVEGWDPVDQTRDLAAGGGFVHGLVADPAWDADEMLRRIRTLADYGPTRRPDDRSLDDYLFAGDWERAGSASFGRVEYRVDTPDGTRHGHFKARKNIVMDVTSFETLRERVRGYDRQENRALVKSELGKIRIAVASPLETYLQMGWLYELAGGFYLRWPGNTLDEPLLAEAARAEKTFSRLKSGQFSLPYDFASFDHQPTKTEIATFQTVVDSVARREATHDQRPDVDLCDRLIQNGHRVAVLHPPGGEGLPPFPVTGGLMSGLRTTSTVGSGWNGVIGKMACDLLSRLTARHLGDEVLLEIRGDDTKVVTPHYLDALGVKLLYDALGATANEAKFGLYHGRVEFLRVETSDRARAYPARNVPGLTQRRPWNAAPWRDEATLCGVVKTCALLRRRSPFPDRVTTLEDHVVGRWMARLGLDERLLSIPQACGGLGVRPWDGRWAVRQWRSDPPRAVEVLNRTDFRVGQITTQFADLGIPVAPEVAGDVATRRLATKIASDDVPAVLPELRRRARAELSRREVIPTCSRLEAFTMELVAAGALLPIFSTADACQGSYARLLDQVRLAAREYCPLFGAMRRFAGRIAALGEIAAATRDSLGALLRKYAPSVFSAVRDIERWLGLRRSMAVDFVLGSASFSTADQRNPFVCRPASLGAAAILGYVRTHFGPMTSFEALWVYDFAANRLTSGLMCSEMGKTYLRV